VARYSIRLKASAAKEIERIEPKKIRAQVVARIAGLAENPRPPGCEKLSGKNDRFRVRQGAWRIVYSIVDQDLVVFVVKVGHRSEVYRNL
jgi:mRNA interferase RelE/StbE